MPIAASVKIVNRGMNNMENEFEKLKQWMADTSNALQGLSPDQKADMAILYGQFNRQLVDQWLRSERFRRMA